ncbi:adenylyltransferase/cytidyltransferase family protein [Bacillus sp. FSL M8-0256]|uniref:adenylyltransferase/cytidyltransferase family protein n=1 Tax=Bacillus sp. FSL M8-0256 TaxID=2954578 RepID=UPI0030FA726C
MNKIKTISQLKYIAEKEREKKHKIVLCHGCFDLLHIGHLRHLKAARKFGDILIVTITKDEFVNKGKGRPAFTEKYRTEMLASLEIVDYVGINEWPSAVNSLYDIRPDYFVKGSDYRNRGEYTNPNIYKEEEVCANIGTIIKYTDELTSSSTKLINEYFTLQEI